MTDPTRDRKPPPNPSRRTIVLVALGANLPGRFGPPRRTLDRAAAALGALPGLRPVACSTWWRTPPVGGPPGAPLFWNGVVRLEGTPDPTALLAWLHALEAAAGRSRGTQDAPRPLDLDLIDVAGAVRAAPHPVLPHPRAHLRRFVLLPLAEVAPGWQHPRLGATVEALLAALPPGGEHPARLDQD